MHFIPPCIGNKHQLFTMLEDCKQIPKNDRLLLRKLIHDNHSDIKYLFQIKDLQKLQIKLRKYLQNWKNENTNFQIINYENNNFFENRPNKVVSLHSCINDVHKSPLQQTINSYRRNPLTLVSKNYKENQTNKSLSTQNIIPQYRKQPQYFHAYQSNDIIFNHTRAYGIRKSQIVTPKHNLLNRTTKTPSMSTLRIPQQFSLTPNHKKICSNTQIEQSLFTNPQLMKQCQKYIQKAQKKIENCFNSPAQQQQFSPIKKVLHLDDECLQYENRLKSILLGVYAEDLLDFILLDTLMNNLSSFQISYKYFIDRLNQFCLHKTGQVFCKDYPIFKPLKDDSYLNIQIMEQFLIMYCFPKLNEVKNLFLKLDYRFKNIIDFEDVAKYYRFNNETIQKLRNLMKIWGTDGKLKYWQFYLSKNSRQFKQFQQAINNPKI